MILWILGISTVCLYLCFVLMSSSLMRSALVLVTGFVMLGSLVVIIDNDNNHLGMRKVETTTERQVYTASPNKQLPLMLYKNIGTSGKHKVYIYKSNPKAKATHTKADFAVNNQIKQVSGTTASVQKQVTTWRYRNSFYKLLFSNKNQGKFEKETNVIKVPKTWYVLSTTQAQKLAKKAKTLTKMSPADKARQKMVVEKQVMAARKKNPKMSAQEQASLVQKITDQMKQQAVKKLIDEVK